MTESAWLAIIAALSVAFASFISTLVAPWVMARMQNEAKLREKEADAAEKRQIRLEDNARQDEIAARVERATLATQGQLKVLTGIAVSTHSLANSGFTESLRLQLAAFEQVLALRKSSTVSMSDGDLAAIKTTEAEIAKLKATISERDVAAERANAAAAAVTADVSDTADAARRSADATEKVASETKRIADAAEGAKVP